MQDKLELAIKLAVEAHAGQLDKSGQPYILHPLAVMLAVAKHGSYAAQMVAVLHDVVEDCPVTLQDLREAGIPDVVVVGVDAITKRSGESYETYLSRVRDNDEALTVKLEDIRHNMSRLTRLEPDHAGYLAKKYTRALQFLGKA